MASPDDPFDLERFMSAQQPVYVQVLDELRAGCKRSHWMWFVFPQTEGLGASAMARRYAIGSLSEAVAYLAHPVLGARLVECTRLVCAAPEMSIRRILGTPDDLKFRSSMTLFREAAAEDAALKGIFQVALDRYFDGLPDERTLERIERDTG